jgi:phosphatidylglycerol---prolipoprotein diacylglyceryl transferase
MTLSPTLGAWMHTLDPFLVQFSDGVGIRWYGVAYLLGFFIAYRLLIWLANRRLVLVPPERVGDAMLWLIGGVLVGGRVGYVLFYEIDLLWRFGPNLPWWGVLAINNGGMASHGGIIGVIIAAYRISRGWRDERGVVQGRCDGAHVMDITAAICPIGLGLGRIANFINGELLGKVHSPAGTPGPWWTVQFPQELLEPAQTPPLTAEQASALGDVLENARLPGEIINQTLIRVATHAAGYQDQLRPLLTSRHPSQLYQALAEGLILGVVLWLIWARPRKPGVVGSAFLIVYGVLRVITELWRLPDAQFLAEGGTGRMYGLSRGQWLSVVMAVAGFVTMAWSLSRQTEKVGGWKRRRGGSRVGV